MPVKSIRFSDAQIREIEQEMKVLGVDFAVVVRRRCFPNSRKSEVDIARAGDCTGELPATAAQRKALDRAWRTLGFSSRSAYIRARLFMSTPPPAPEFTPSERPREIVTFSISRADRQALAKMAHAYGFKRRTDFTHFRVFGHASASR